MTKLQNLYRAAIAADATVAVPSLTIDTKGQWASEADGYVFSEDAVVFALMIRLSVLGCNSRDDVCPILERIARKEAK